VKERGKRERIGKYDLRRGGEVCGCKCMRKGEKTLHRVIAVVFEREREIEI
jgi:hypothetical protein